MVEVIDKLASSNIKEVYNEVKDFLYNGEGTVKERKSKVIKILGEDMTVGKAIISLATLSFLADHVNMEFDSSDLFRGSSAADIDTYVTNIGEVAKSLGLADLKEKIFGVIQELMLIAERTNSINGITVDLYSLAKAYKNSKAVQEVIDFQLDETKTFDEMSDEMSKLTERVEEVFSSEDSPFRELVKGGAVNGKQITQCFSCVGLKPNLDDQICEHVVNTSFIKGLRNVDDFWVSATGARKALIISHKQVSRSGYLARKLLLLVSDIVLSDEEACDTKHPLEYSVPTIKHFKKFTGRTMADGTVIDGSQEQFARLKDGKLRVFSPVTCSCKTGICRRCYGELSKRVEGYRIGTVGVLLLTEILTQRLLSAKHLLMAKTKPIEWPKNFLEYFDEDRNCLSAGNNLRKLVINRDDFKEDEDGNLVISTITAKNKKNSEVFNLPVDLYPKGGLAEELESYKQEYAYNVDDGEELFNVRRQSVELNEVLTKLISLIQTEDHNGHGNDYVAIANEFLSDIVEGSVNIASVHSEVILSALLKENGEKPDFSKEEMGDISVLRLNDGIDKKNLSTVLSFESLRRKLQDPKTYEKSEEGVYDKFFMT
jgi:hypothetical protein